MLCYTGAVVGTDDQDAGEKSDGEAHFRDRRRGQLAGQRSHMRLDRDAPGASWVAGPAPEVRPVHQRRSRDDEPISARRGLRARRRGGDRPRPRPLRAVYRRAPNSRLQLHDGQDLPFSHQQRARGEALRGPDRPGHPARHRRDQGGHPPPGRRRRGRRDHRDRRHGRRYREPPLPGGDPPVRPRRRPRELPLYPPDARPLPQGRR